jgi:hypothetical protein
LGKGEEKGSMQLLQADFWEEEEGKSMQLILGRVTFSLSLYL